tara:strand:- start:77 stop:241 length:165 start_codon:yes stop_codon:yes gene_type:complete
MNEIKKPLDVVERVKEPFDWEKEPRYPIAYCPEDNKFIYFNPLDGELKHGENYI